MGRDKNNGKGGKGAATRDTTTAKTTSDNKPGFEGHSNGLATTATGETKSNPPPLSGAPTAPGNANQGDTRQVPDSPKRDLPVPTTTLDWFNFQTGDMQVFVAETHVFRVHQEILAAHSTFFREQLQMSMDSSGIVTAPRSQDIPVVVLRDICADAFIDVLHIIYPRPGADTQSSFTASQAERLLQTAKALGMPKILNIAMRRVVSDPKFTPVAIYELAQEVSLPRWQLTAIRELVYRTRPLSDEEAQVLGVVTTARVARLREEFRARIFARFEPVVQPDPIFINPKPHQSGDDSDLVRWSTFGTAAGIRPELGKCQKAILEALKVVFNVEGLKNDWAYYVIQGERSVMGNLAEWLRLGRMGGGAVLCGGCLASVDKAAKLYCRQDEMDERIEKEMATEID